MSAPVSANDIRNRIRESLQQLLLLQEQGRIVMTRDRYNTDWPDSVHALNEAIRGLELAMSATHWMETLPQPDGRYPTLQSH